MPKHLPSKLRGKKIQMEATKLETSLISFTIYYPLQFLD
jgi:hypothetical protein